MLDRQQVRPLAAAPAIVEIVQIHAVYAYRPGAWACEVCPFLGELGQAIRHVVAMQWDHVWWPR